VPAKSSVMRWEEINKAAKVWTVPAARMKTAREHRVRFCERSLAVLDEAEKARTGDFVFPGSRGAPPLSVMAMEMDLRRMNLDSVTVYGLPVRLAARGCDGCGTGEAARGASEPDLCLEEAGSRQRREPVRARGERFGRWRGGARARDGQALRQDRPTDGRTGFLGQEARAMS